MKTLLLRNTWCDFTCPWCNKTDGTKGHSFIKGEIFEVPETLERKDEQGNVRQVSALDLLNKMFPIGIEVAKGAVSAAKMKEKDDEIARLKAELAAAKGAKGKGKKSAPEVPAADAAEASTEPATTEEAPETTEPVA